MTILISLPAKPESLEKLRRICPHAEIRTGPWINQAQMRLDPGLMKGVESLLCELPPANFDDFDRLKWIQLCSAGYNQVLNLPVLERGIRVTNGLGNFDGPIAQWNIMMVLMWHRRMLEQLENQKKHVWDPAGRFQSDLFGATVGFWGYGGISRETARLAKALKLHVWVMTRDGKIRDRHSIYCVQGTGDPEGKLPDRIFGPPQLEEFLGGLDYLILGMALTPATRGMIGERELRMLKPSTVVINPTRATIIDEQAFIRSLREQWIRGAALDVHYAYPLPPEHPLWNMPNLIMTPHISGSVESPHFEQRIFDIFAQNLTRFMSRQPLLNELSETQLRGG